MTVECEPQLEEDDHDYGGGREQHAEEPEDLGLDLLARARLLCQAANEIALPMLRSVQQLQANKPATAPPTKARKAARPSRPPTREEDEPSTGHARQKHKVEASKPSSRAKSRETPPSGKKMSKPLDALPPIAAPAALPPTLPGGEKAKAPAKPTTQIKPKRKKEEEEEEPAMPLPQINATEEWRKQREAEKIRHAQERAKARVLRKTNHVDALPPTKSNQHAEEENARRPDSSEASKDAALGQIEANRRRALERVKLRKLELAEEQARAAAANQEVAVQQPSDELVKKTEAFRHRTLQRLQAAKREALAQDSQSAEAEKVIEPQEDAEEKERERRRLAKQRRRETAERLKRQQQVAEEQQRKEQELFEKGLNEFKTKKKEQDRIAKGLAPTRPLTDPVHPIGVFEPEDPEPSSAEPLSHIPLSGLLGSRDQSAEIAVVVDIPSSDDLDHNPSDEQGLSLSIPITEVPHDANNETHQASNDTVGSRPRPKKAASWKQPPVPILPAECYAQKALVSPSDSYSERFQLRTGRTSPTTIPEVTFSPLHHGTRRSNNND